MAKTRHNQTSLDLHAIARVSPGVTLTIDNTTITSSITLPSVSAVNNEKQKIVLDEAKEIKIKELEQGHEAEIMKDRNYTVGAGTYTFDFKSDTLLSMSFLVLKGSGVTYPDKDGIYRKFTEQQFKTFFDEVVETKENSQKILLTKKKQVESLSDMTEIENISFI